ncbi:MAG: hypothetical protein H7346_17760 [Burkholderiaceae bacterium]|nr:hypothetical protein [Burkholderiaceae bacterium]
MASPRTLSRLDTLIWALIFGGLFTLAFSLVFRQEGVVLSWGLGTLGALATVTGAVLIYVRSRLTEDS